MKHLTTPPNLGNVPVEFRRVLERALAKNPVRRYQTMAEMAKDLAAIGGAVVPMAKVLPPLQAAAPTVHAPPAFAEPIPEVLPVNLAPRVWLGELAGSLAMSAVLALLLCIVWAAVLRTNNLTKIAPYFFLTLACSWAVLVPAKLWTKRVDDSWRRRITLMCLGVLIGVQALWLEGYELPSLLTAEARANETAVVAADGDGAIRNEALRHWYSGGLLVRGREVPVAACYLTYFGLAFFLLRWWKMADRRRKHRFSFWSVFVAVACSWTLVGLVWPTDEQAMASLIDPMTVIVVPVMASVVIQLVSPWEAPPPRKSRKLRLPNA